MKRNRVPGRVLLAVCVAGGVTMSGTIAGPSGRSGAVEPLMAQADMGVEECRRSCETRFDCTRFDTSLDVPIPETPDFGQQPGQGVGGQQPGPQGMGGSSQPDSTRGLDTQPPGTPLRSEADECRDRLRQCLRDCG